MVLSIDRPRLHQSLNLLHRQAEQVAKDILVVLAEERGGTSNAARGVAQAPRNAM